MAAGGPRYDLNGQSCGDVSAEHRETASTRIARMGKRIAAKQPEDE
ncbi:TPA: ProQ/FINO family protein [Serratia marcescens]